VLKIDPVLPRFSGFLMLNATLVHHEFHGALMGTIPNERVPKVSYRSSSDPSEGRRIADSFRVKAFTRRALAQKWLRRREVIEEAQATGLPVQGLVTLKQILQDYVSDAKGIVAWGRSKTADITRLQKAKLAHRDARHLRAIDFIEYARWRRTKEAGTATVLNDIVWLRQACLGAVAARHEQAGAGVDAAKQEAAAQDHLQARHASYFAGLGRKKGSCRQLTDHCASRVQCLQVCLMGNKIWLLFKA
jgi:hypothetical protein